MTRLLIIIAISVLITSCATDTSGYSSQYETSQRYRSDNFVRHHHSGYGSHRSYSNYRGYRHHGYGHNSYRHHSYGGYSRHGYRSGGYRRRGY